MNHLLSPAFPTFPVQDKFGNVQLFPGLTKLEHVAAMIFSNSTVLTHSECVEQAIHLLDAVQDKMVEMTLPPKPSIIAK